jgi:hypothetical protein
VRRVLKDARRGLAVTGGSWRASARRDKAPQHGAPLGGELNNGRVHERRLLTEPDMNREDTGDPRSCDTFGS